MEDAQNVSDYTNYPLATLAALDRNPRGIALITPAHGMSNGDLAELVRRYAAHLALRGITAQSRVVLALRNGPTGFAAALALGLLGAQWIAFHSKAPLATIGTTHLLHGKDKPDFKHPGMIEVDASWANPPGGESQAHRFQGFAHADDVAFYTKSSGTTGTPKFMVKTAVEVVGTLDMSKFAGVTAVTSLPPLLSSMSFRNAIAAMLCGVRVGLVEPKPGPVGEAATLQAMGVDLVMGSPAQIHSICRGLLPLPRRMGSARVGGAIVDHRAIRHWLGFFEEVVLIYGARETGRTLSLSLREVKDDTEIAYPLQPGMEVEIVDEAGAPLPHSVPGTLRLRSAGMVTGYVGAPEDSAAVFRDGWFYPGDLALLTEDGRLKIFGRLKDQLNVGGVKFNGEDIDAAARSAAGVADAMCFASTDARGVAELSMAVLAAAAGTEAATAAAIRAACKEAGRAVPVSHIYFVPSLPINDNGKAVRSEGPRLAALTKSY